jgi:hypothetical protein
MNVSVEYEAKQNNDSTRLTRLNRLLDLARTLLLVSMQNSFFFVLLNLVKR